ncbi:nitrous oxide reductase family maturation protein NosD [Halobacteriota archaeon]
MKNKSEKLWAFFIVLAVVISSIGSTAIAANGQVNPTVDAQDETLTIIYVPDDYPTIQAAVNATSDGDTIIVRDGAYTENIFVDKRLTIKSENGYDLTLIQAQNIHDHVFNVTADYVSISGFKIRGANYSSGIYLGSDVDHCNIADNKVLDNMYGIHLYSSSSNIISNNNASNNWQGIRLQYSSSNIISNNSAPNKYYGIHLYSSSSNIISNNNASNNNGGIRLSSSSSNIISNNNFNTNKYYGIYFYYSNGNIISNNNASNNWQGIYFWYSNGNTLSSNTASNNDHGIYVSMSHSNIISNNNFNLNNDHGIFLTGSRINTISINTISNNNWGIYLEYSSNNNTISGNAFSNNNIDDVYISPASMGNVFMPIMKNFPFPM